MKSIWLSLDWKKGLSHKSITFKVVGQLGANSEINFLIVSKKRSVFLEIRYLENLLFACGHTTLATIFH